jgi:hypothetical protein
MSAVIEWEEWGNPGDPEFYDYMKVRLLCFSSNFSWCCS